MGSTVLNIALLIVAIIIAGAITFLAAENIDLDVNTQIIAGVVLTLAVFVSLYSMTKSHGGGG